MELSRNHDDEVSRYRVPVARKGLTVMGASVNMANGMMGSGLLGLAAVSQKSGLVAYILFQLVTCGAAIFTVMLLVRCTEKSGSTLESIGETAFGVWGTRLVAVSVCLHGIGALLSYITITGEVFPSLYAQWTCINDSDVAARTREVRTPCMVLITTFIILPLTLAPSINALKYSSLFGLTVFLTFAVSCIIVLAVEPHGAGEIHLFRWTPMLLVNLPATLFATNCHHVILSIYHELQERNRETIQQVVMCGYGFGMLVYLSVATAGYCHFRDDTVSDLVQNLPRTPIVEALRIAMLLAILMGYPNIHWAVRRSILSCVFGAHYQFRWRPHIICAVCVVSFTLIIGIITPNLAIVINFVGSTASTWLVLGLPSLLAIRLKVGNKWHSIACLIAALFIGTCGFTANIIAIA